MRAIQAGHLDLLGVLYERHSGRVFAQCLRAVGDPTVADDLVQEAFLRVLRYRSSFRGEARFSTWLHRIAGNVCLDHLRARGKQAAVDSEFAATAEDTETPEPERLAMLRAALARLPADKRELLRMCRIEGLTYAQAAERLGAREGTVRVRVHRALGELRSILESLGEGGS